MKVPIVSLLVWGDFACFTRPEMKVERVSYPIMTPAAARGVLEAILWEPQFYYVIQEISVVKHETANGKQYGKGQWLSFRRNELQSVVSISSAKSWMNGTKSVSYIHAGGGAEDATQRNTLALQSVAYLIQARIQLSALAKQPRDNPQKYYERFRKRARTGKCFHRPCFGCREFAVDFEWCEDPSLVPVENWPEEDLGWMIYDIFDPSHRQEGFAWFRDDLDLPDSYAKKQKQSQKQGYVGTMIEPTPVFFRAQIKDGRMNCDPGQIEILRS